MRLLERLRPSRSRDERGVMAVAVALITCFTLIPLAAFAVDIGVQRVARRDAQSVADVVALDLSRQLDGRTYTELMSASPSMQTLANRSAARNAVTGNDFSVSFELGTLTVGNFDPQNPDSDSYFHPVTSGTPNAVRVTVKAKVGFAFISGSGGVVRSAIGSGGGGGGGGGGSPQSACLMMDSYAAALSTGDSTVLGPLNRILGTSVDTQVLSSSGILTANLDVLRFLGVLQTQLGVGGIDQVLSANVSAAQIVAAEVAALNADGSSAVAQALQSQVGLHVPAGSQINVGTLLGVTQGGTSGLGGTLNPFDLASAAVQLANGSSALALSVSGANLVGLTAQATVGSKPTRVCLGDGKKAMDQTSVQANAKLDSSGTLVGTVTNLVNGLTGLLSTTLCGVGALLGGNCYSAPTISDITLNANLSLAQASGTVTDVNCANKRYLTAVEQSKLAPATASLSFTVTMKHTYYNLLGTINHVDTLTATVTTTISTDTPADKSVTDKLYDPDDLKKAKAGQSGDLSLNNLSVTTTTSGNIELINKLGGLVNSVNSLLITPVLSTTVTPLLNGLTSSLKNLVGLTIAGSTYTLLPYVDCGTPGLVG